ncbi:MAG: hypothetical protein J0653_01130 [Deltaproteobacteria bacterium]|nr:hypothetical protein [Deltaproteobacteria bacterium]
MKAQVQPIALSPNLTQSSERVVKRSALAVFRLVRGAVERTQTVPALLAQVSSDVHEAWQESSRPNV